MFTDNQVSYRDSPKLLLDEQLPIFVWALCLHFWHKSKHLSPNTWQSFWFVPVCKILSIAGFGIEETTF